MLEIAGAWRENYKISDGTYEYLSKNVAFPWSMIDKITPRPDEKVEKQLAADGFEHISPFVTAGAGAVRATLRKYLQPLT